MPKIVHSVDLSYFKTINTEAKAYWLGFLYADGCVRTKQRRQSCSIRMNLQIRDKAHVEAFQRALQASQPIEEIVCPEREIRGRTIGPSRQARITISRAALVQDLIDNGCGPRKSQRLVFPTEKQVPPSLVRHFLRGYFDGDGTVYISPRKGVHQFMTAFLGNREFLERVNEVISTQCVVTPSRIYQSTGICYIAFGGNRTAAKVLSYLYDGASVYLQRKHDLHRQLQDGNRLRDESREWLTFRSPHGTVFKTQSISEFSREHGLNHRSLSHLKTGRRKCHKGWVFQPVPDVQTSRTPGCTCHPAQACPT